MHISEYKRVEKLENIHFWYKAMDESVIDEIVRLRKGRNLRILDAGCGTGGFSEKLMKFGEVCALDINNVALQYARKKRIYKVIKGSVEKLPFKNNFFDMVVCLDVLYHQKVKSDQRAIYEFFRVLKPEGYLLLRLPAFEGLRGTHDLIVQTKHRYTCEEIKTKLEKSGFSILKLSYANMMLSIPLFLKRLLERKKLIKNYSSDTVMLPGVLNAIMYKYLQSENRLLNFMKLPFGSSVVCLAQKVDLLKSK